MKKKKMQKKKMSLSTFWMLLISMLSILLVGVCMITFIHIYQNSLYQAASINSEQAVSQVVNTIGIYSDEMKQDIKYLENEIKVCNTKEDIRKSFMSMLQMQNNLVSIMIYSKDGELLNYYAIDQKLKKDQSKSLSYYPEMFSRGRYEISAPHIQNLFESYYPWVATIGDSLNSSLYGEEVYLVMDVRFFSILSYVDNVSIGQHGYCFVVNNNGDLVYHPQQQLIFAGLKEEELHKLCALKDGVYIQKDVIYSVKSSQENPWKVVGVSYTNELVQQKIWRALKTIAISALMCMSIAWFIIQIFSNKVSKPVKQLVLDMKEFEKNAEYYRYESIKGIDEVQMLSESFAHMVLIIQQLMDKVKKEEITLRKAELKALQTQINPHFLYNTLDSIQWMCEREDREKAVEMVSALAKFFRISISKGHELITIENEIEHAKNYLIIQKFRYSNQFAFHFDIEEGVLSYYCNKIILQPLIENAIIHGMDATIEDGEITIRAKETKDAICLIVEDNGNGMTEEQLRNILHCDGNKDYGIGLKNVNDRIQIYFGEQFGVFLESELDEGTKVTIRLPKITQEDARKIYLNE